MPLVHALSVFDRLKLTAPPLWLAVALPIAYFTAAVVTVSLFTHNTPIWLSNSLVVTALLRNRRSTSLKRAAPSAANAAYAVGNAGHSQKAGHSQSARKYPEL